MSSVSENALPLLDRLWIYQYERFPLLRTVPLLAVFSAASVTVSASLGGRPLPHIGVYIAAFTCVLVVFWQMRAMDELKDFETDRTYRPERPVPRGLISLRTILWLGAIVVLPAIAAAYAVEPRLVLFLSAVWVWLALMTKEFFIPEKLHRSPALYLVSHMAIMPLIDLFLTACEWLPRAGSPPVGIWTFLWMSFCNGCVVEFGRKIWAPSNERPGVETYSANWGLEGSVIALATAVIGGFLGLVACGFFLGHAPGISAAGGLAVVYVLWIVARFKAAPVTENQKRLETATGLWVVACYLTPAVLPYLLVSS